jgi:uncharacterized protein YqeY
MMYEKLKAHYQEVRRDKTAKVQQALLSTILGDLQKIEIDNKNVTDEPVIALIKKYRENAISNDSYGMPNAKEEIHILSNMLPKQLTEAEITAIITSMLKQTPTATLGAVMTYMKSNYAGLYDAKFVSATAKKRLSN